MATDVALQHAIQALRAGDRAAARAMLHTFTEAQPSSVDGWLWLAAASDDPADKRSCVQRAMSLDPSDARVQAALRTLNASSAVAPSVTSVAAPATPAPETPRKPAAHPLAAPRFAPTRVRARQPISWRIVALASLLLVVAIPLVVLLSS